MEIKFVVSPHANIIVTLSNCIEYYTIRAGKWCQIRTMEARFFHQLIVYGGLVVSIFRRFY